MGIPDPVTRETHGTGDKYYTMLARQLTDVLTKPVEVRLNNTIHIYIQPSLEVAQSVEPLTIHGVDPLEFMSIDWSVRNMYFNTYLNCYKLIL